MDAIIPIIPFATDARGHTLIHIVLAAGEDSLTSEEDSVGHIDVEEGIDKDTLYIESLHKDLLDEAMQRTTDGEDIDFGKGLGSEEELLQT